MRTNTIKPRAAT